MVHAAVQRARPGRPVAVSFPVARCDLVPVRPLGHAASELLYKKAAAMNAHQSLAIGQRIETRDAISPAATAPDAMVRFEGISKTYPAYRGKPGVNALQDIDFAIPRGSITGVIGRSGAGKSSLVRLINGLEKPTTGRVIVDNKDISALAGRELRLAQRSIGMIFQHFNLLSSRTAADNIALPLEIADWARADIKARVAELLALVGIADKHDRYPSELSGGQKQRVGIARALAGPATRWWRGLRASSASTWRCLRRVSTRSAASTWARSPLVSLSVFPAAKTR
ncbi:ABC-type ATPase involved in cell division [Bradyrhizobium diazoefficiens]